MQVDTFRAILSRLLPKTGQSTSYHTADDGAYEIGWWRGKTIANNLTRFISKTIGGDVVVIDRATGLIWAADGAALGCRATPLLFGDAINYAFGLTFAGYSDWRVPNLFELVSIHDVSLSNCLIPQPPFSNTCFEELYMTSTTFAGITTYCYQVNPAQATAQIMLKASATASLRCVRGGK